jgi:hypothetical protein
MKFPIQWSNSATGKAILYEISHTMASHRSTAGILITVEPLGMLLLTNSYHFASNGAPSTPLNRQQLSFCQLLSLWGYSCSLTASKMPAMEHLQLRLTANSYHFASCWRQLLVNRQSQAALPLSLCPFAIPVPVSFFSWVIHACNNGMLAEPAENGSGTLFPVPTKK